MFTAKPIGFVRSSYRQMKEIPKGVGTKHEAEGVLDILPEYGPGLTDIEGFSHLFVLWEFHRSRGFQLLSAQPHHKQPHGIFAARCPGRPNPIGLTVVELLERDQLRLRVRGVDMLDGTPILDIKPYLSNVLEGRLRRGWMEESEALKSRHAGERLCQSRLH